MESQVQRPIPACYWVLPGKFLAGEYPGSESQSTARERIRAFVDAGVTYFVDLTEEDSFLEPYAEILADEARRRGTQVVHRRTPIVDLTVPSTGQMTEILNAIDLALETVRSSMCTAGAESGAQRHPVARRERAL